MKRLLGQFRLALILILAILVVLVDSVSRVLSMCADLVFIVGMLALCWGPLTKDRRTHKESADT